MFVGSCFAAYIGEQMKIRKMPAMINPSGTIYNPESILTAISNITSNKHASIAELHNFNNIWISFNHYTDFSSDDSDKLLSKINEQNEKAHNFLKKASFLFITFGTARVYRFKKTGAVVSNCHKIPSVNFDSELLSVENIVDKWKPILDELSAFNSKLKVVFTISPVRHWKNGAYGNQLSKSILFLAVDELVKHKTKPSYFPAYEIQMDDLRDYRFYADDMLHPSSSAIDYIWEKFSEIYFDKPTVDLQQSVHKITQALEHRLMTDSKMKKKMFAEKMLKQINNTTQKTSLIDFSSETEYFNQLL
jgi:uncharacterized UPF0146 family protein